MALASSVGDGPRANRVKYKMCNWIDSRNNLVGVTASRTLGNIFLIN